MLKHDAWLKINFLSNQSWVIYPIQINIIIYNANEEYDKREEEKKQINEAFFVAPTLATTGRFWYVSSNIPWY